MTDQPSTIPVLPGAPQAPTNPTVIPAEIPAMIFNEKKAHPKLGTYTPKPFALHDVDIHVMYTGVCGMDQHFVDNDLGMSRYPLIPGHEVVGRVLAVGDTVPNIKVGDIVGLGPQCQACDTCEFCQQMRPQMCLRKVFTFQGDTVDETGKHPHHGGFGSFIRTDGRFLFKIPEGYPEECFGPLLCAGLTVFSPLMEDFPGMDAGGQRIGIVGIGGLGHMALQFASKMNAETWAISRSSAKRHFATGLGATGYVDMSDAAEVSKAAGTFHYLLVCISGKEFNIAEYLPLLRPYGKMHVIGIPKKDLSFPIHALMQHRLSLSASSIGSPEQTRSMIEFAVKHDIKPLVEVFPHTRANDALQKLRDSEIRFRAVLKNDLV